MFVKKKLKEEREEDGVQRQCRISGHLYFFYGKENESLE